MKSMRHIPCAKLLYVSLCLVITLHPATSPNSNKSFSMPDDSEPESESISESSIPRHPDMPPPVFRVRQQERHPVYPPVDAPVIDYVIPARLKTEIIREIRKIKNACPSLKTLRYLRESNKYKNFQKEIYRFRELGLNKRISFMRDFEEKLPDEQNVIGKDSSGIEYGVDKLQKFKRDQEGQLTAKVFIFPSVSWAHSDGSRIRKLKIAYPDMNFERRIQESYFRLESILKLNKHYYPRMCNYINLESFCGTVDDFNSKRSLLRDQAQRQDKTRGKKHFQENLNTSLHILSADVNFFEMFVSFQTKHDHTFLDLINFKDSDTDTFLEEYPLLSRVKIAHLLVEGLMVLNQKVFHCDINPSNIAIFYLRDDTPEGLYTVQSRRLQGLTGAPADMRHQQGGMHLEDNNIPPQVSTNISRQTFKIINFQYARDISYKQDCKPPSKSYLPVQDLVGEFNESRDFFALGLVLLEMEIEMKKNNFYLSKILDSFWNIEETLNKSNHLNLLSMNVIVYFEAYVIPSLEIGDLILRSFQRYRHAIEYKSGNSELLARFTRQYDLKDLANHNSSNKQKKDFVTSSHECFFKFLMFLKKKNVKNIFIQLPSTLRNEQDDFNLHEYGKYLDFLIRLIIFPKPLYSIVQIYFRNAIKKITGDAAVRDPNREKSDLSGNKVNLCDWKKYLNTNEIIRPNEQVDTRGANRSEMNMREGNSPNMNFREVDRLEVNRPEVNRPAVNRLEVNRPEVNRIAVNRPALNRPAVNRLVVNRPALNRPTVNRPALNRLVVNSHEMDLSGMDLSGMDIGGMNMGGMDIGGMDTSRISKHDNNDSEESDDALLRMMGKIKKKNVTRENEGHITGQEPKREHAVAFPKSNPTRQGQGSNLKKVNRSGKDQNRQRRSRDQMKQRVTRILNNKRIKRQKNILLC